MQQVKPEKLQGTKYAHFYNAIERAPAQELVVGSVVPHRAESARKAVLQWAKRNDLTVRTFLRWTDGQPKLYVRKVGTDE